MTLPTLPKPVKEVTIHMTLYDNGAYYVQGMIRQGQVNLGGTIPKYCDDFESSVKHARKLITRMKRQKVLP